MTSPAVWKRVVVVLCFVPFGDLVIWLLWRLVHISHEALAFFWPLLLWVGGALSIWLGLIIGLSLIRAGWWKR